MSDRELVSAILDMQEQPLPVVDHTVGMTKEEFMAKWMFSSRK